MFPFGLLKRMFFVTFLFKIFFDLFTYLFLFFFRICKKYEEINYGLCGTERVNNIYHIRLVAPSIPRQAVHIKM